MFFYTGQGSEEIARQAFLLGASDYFVKSSDEFVHKEKFVNSLLNAIEKRKTDQILQKKNRQLQRITGNLSDIIFELDKEGSLIYISPSVEKVLGYKAEDILKNPQSIISSFSPESNMIKQIREFTNNYHLKDSSQDIDFETSCYHNNGNLFWVRVRIIPFYEPDHVIGGFHGVVEDITNKKMVEESLRKLEEEKALFINSTTDLIAFHEPDLRIVWANNKAYNLEGDNKSIIGRYCYEIHHGYNKPCKDCPLIKARETKMPQEGEITTQNNKTYFVRGYPIKDEKDNVTGILEFCKDLTRYRNIEKALTSTEEKYSAMETSYYGIAILQNRQIKFANKTLLKTLGYSQEEIIGKCISQLIHPDEVMQLSAFYRAVESGSHSSIETSFLHKNGKRIEVEINISGTDFEGEAASLFQIKDITKSRSIERQLQRDKFLLDQMIEQNPVGICVFDSRGFFVKGNKAYYELFKAVPPPDYNVFEDVILKRSPFYKDFLKIKEGFAVKMPEMAYNLREHSPQLPDATILLKATAYPLFTPEGEMNSIVVMHDDLGNCSRLSGYLPGYDGLAELSGELYGIGIAILQNEKIAQVNGVLAETLAYSRDELIEKSLMNYIAAGEEELKELESFFRYESKTPGEIEVKLKTKKGTIIPAKCKIQPIKYFNDTAYYITLLDMSKKFQYKKTLEKIFKNLPVIIWSLDAEGNITMAEGYGLKAQGFKSQDIQGRSFYKIFGNNEDLINSAKRAQQGNSDGIIIKIGEVVYDVRFTPIINEMEEVVGVTGAAVDITEIKKIEQKLLNKNKELKDFAYRVSHDLKNPINIIKGFLTIIKEEPALFDEYFDRIIQQTDHLLSFIDSLLKLSKTGMIIDKKINVNIKPILTILASLYKSQDTSIEILIPEEIPIIQGSPEGLEQVFDNLIQNSIKYKDPDKDCLKIEIHCETLSNGLTIHFVDNGIGIEEKYLDKLFAPGFTISKKGTGFGLAIAQKIIDAHGGSIWAESEGQNKGARFTILLPLL